MAAAVRPGESLRTRPPDQGAQRSVASRLDGVSLCSHLARVHPLISCLCVTRGKPDKLVRAIECFDAQNYPNRELLVLCEEDDAATRQAVDQLVHSGAAIEKLVVGVSPKRSLGELRNLAVRHCRGEYFCQWDDDD